MTLQLDDHLVQLVGQLHALPVGIDQTLLGLAKKGTKHRIGVQHVAYIGFRHLAGGQAGRAGTFHHQIGLLGDIAGRIDDFVRAPDANVALIIMSNPVQSKGINQAAQTLFQTRSRMNRLV